MGGALWLIASGCAGTPGPGDPSYPYNVSGSYGGRFMIDDQPFNATLQLRTTSGGRVSGAIRVSMPVETEGRVVGTVFDDLLRVTITYRDPSGCEGSIEGIVTIERGGGTIDGPVTVTDCSGPIAGRMSFRRTERAPGQR
jgi:hypothetical protein